MFSTDSGRSYSQDDGARLVRAARHAIELHLSSKNFNRRIVESELDWVSGTRGVFVTIYHYPTRTLRGCIGVTKPIDDLAKSLVDVALAAATEDPRFVPVSHREFDHIVIEVNVLTDPQKMNGSPEEIRKAVKVGRDGLLVEYGYHSGLLLPEVPVEEGWNAEKFLEGVCEKAGLPRHQWRQAGVKLYTFSSQIFRETSPGGNVEEVTL